MFKKIVAMMILIMTLCSCGQKRTGLEMLQVAGWVGEPVTTYNGWDDGYETTKFNGKIVMSDDRRIEYIFGNSNEAVDFEVYYEMVLDDIFVISITIGYINIQAKVYSYLYSDADRNTRMTNSVFVETISKLAMEDWVGLLKIYNS